MHAGFENFPQELNLGLSAGENVVHQDHQHDLQDHPTEHWCGQGLYAQSTAIYPADS